MSKHEVKAPFPAQEPDVQGKKREDQSPWSTCRMRNMEDNEQIQEKQAYTGEAPRSEEYSSDRSWEHC